MLDSLEGYLDNIAAAATQTAATGTPLADLAASLKVSVDTVARQHIEIKRLTEHINALRKKGVSITASVPNTEDNNATTCKYCKAVGRSVPHRNNHCFFDPRKNKSRVDWAAKLMEAKGIVFNDAWHVGTAQSKTVVLLNDHNKEKLQDEASLRCSPTNNAYVSNKTDKHLPPEKTGIVDSGATHIYIAPNAPYEKMDTTGKHIRVGTANGQVPNYTDMATLPIPQVKADFPTKRLYYTYIYKHTHWSGSYLWCGLHSGI